jgi:hypothetical protein
MAPQATAAERRLPVSSQLPALALIVWVDIRPIKMISSSRARRTEAFEAEGLNTWDRFDSFAKRMLLSVVPSFSRACRNSTG